MRRVVALVTVLAIASWLAMPLSAYAAVKVAVIEVKGMVCTA
jgi:hypothetical protein